MVSLEKRLKTCKEAKHLCKMFALCNIYQKKHGITDANCCLCLKLKKNSILLNGKAILVDLGLYQTPF